MTPVATAPERGGDPQDDAALSSRGFQFVTISQLLGRSGDAVMPPVPQEGLWQIIMKVSHARYRWHPWFGREAWIHQAKQCQWQGEAVVRCGLTPDLDAGGGSGGSR